MHGTHMRKHVNAIYDTCGTSFNYTRYLWSAKLSAEIMLGDFCPVPSLRPHRVTGVHMCTPLEISTALQALIKLTAHHTPHMRSSMHRTLK